MGKLLGLLTALSMSFAAKAEILDCYSSEDGAKILFASIEHREQDGIYISIRGSPPEQLHYLRTETKLGQDWAGEVTYTHRQYYLVRWMLTDEIHLTTRCGGHSVVCSTHGHHVDNSANQRKTPLSCKLREVQL